MEQGTLGLAVEALDVQQPAVARVHDHRNAVKAGTLAGQELDVEAVALLHQHVEPAGAHQELVEVVLIDTVWKAFHTQVRIDLGDLARRDIDLRHAQIVHSGAQAIEIGKIEGVEICQTDCTRAAFDGQSQGDGLADRQADDANALRSQYVAFRRRDLVKVAIGAQLDELGLVEQMHQAERPRVVGPNPILGGRPATDQPRRVRRQFGTGQFALRVANPRELLQLCLQGVEQHDLRHPAQCASQLVHRRTGAEPEEYGPEFGRGGSGGEISQHGGQVHGVRRRADFALFPVVAGIATGE